MLILSIFLGLLGLALSASFSGSETAFYRIPKLRLKLDAMDGDRTAARLLWFVNNPSLFVATILFGNNVANYTVSVATVLFVGAILPDSKGIAVELGSTLLLAPFLFVYGEMFPKYLCLNAPNRALRRLTPLLTFFYRLFLPITSLLWILHQGVSKLLGDSKEMLRLTLGRQELARVLDEGRETGILFDTQRHLADGIFNVSEWAVRDWAIPRSSWPLVTLDMKPAEVLEIARRYDLSEIPVYDSPRENPAISERELREEAGELPIGYVRVIDLIMVIRNHLDDQAKQLLQLMQTELPIRSTVEISGRHSLLTSMILMQTLHGTFGCILDGRRRCVGFIRSDQLRQILLDHMENGLDRKNGKKSNQFPPR